MRIHEITDVDVELAEDMKRLKAAATGALAVGALTAGIGPIKKVIDYFDPKPAAVSVVQELLSNKDQKLLALTIWGEARGHGKEGMRAVAHVIMNRIKADRPMFGGGSMKGVALKPLQFSCWNKGDPNREAMYHISELPKGSADYLAWVDAQKIAKDVASGVSEDPTHGALYYHTTAVKPAWATDQKPIARVANHVFYNTMATADDLAKKRHPGS